MAPIQGPTVPPPPPPPPPPPADTVQQAIDHAVGAVTAAMRDGFEAVAEAARKEAATGR